MTKNKRVAIGLMAASVTNIAVAAIYGFATFGLTGTAPVWWSVWVLLPSFAGALLGAWFMLKREKVRVTTVEVFRDEFRMTDKDVDGNTVSFDIIEDESGDTYWAIGHDITPEYFRIEINRWLKHTGVLDEGCGRVLVAPPHLDRLWAKYNPNEAEYFSLVEPPAGHPSDSEKFPVTRVML